MTDEQIYYAILGDVRIGRKMRSPLPPRDDNPSFWLFRTESGILWHDARRTDRYDRSARGLMREVFGADGWRLLKSRKVPEISLKEDPKPKRELVLRDYDNHTLEFWDQHGVSRRDLLRNRCYVVDRYAVNSKTLFRSEESRVYAYVFGKESYQLYRPDENRNIRFRSLGITNVLFGYQYLESGGPLIITSSNKDRIVLSSLGYKACAPSGETVNTTIFRNYADMRLRFDKIYLLYDNDEVGVSKMTALSKELEVIPVVLGAALGKDPAEHVLRDREHLRNFLNQNINGTIRRTTN